MPRAGRGAARPAGAAGGADRVVFGSNAPTAHPDLAVESIARLGLPQDQFDLIMGGNLARIYGL
ncbi:MAG: amidohydrolase family protein [Chloroflexi bacterium]|nr:amidohydrolase family protein [Chloroflexota bacterium]